MPVLDGFAATRRIRRWEAEQAQGRHMAVIAMTANATTGDAREDWRRPGDQLTPPDTRQARTHSQARAGEPPRPGRGRRRGGVGGGAGGGGAATGVVWGGR